MSTKARGLPSANTEGRDAFLPRLPDRPEVDPKLVFVGVSVGRGGLEPETEEALARLKDGSHDLPWRFLVRRCAAGSIVKSRNILAAVAWSTPAAAYLSVDADNKFGLGHVRRVMSSPHRCVGGIYPKKELLEEAQFCVTFDEGESDGQGRQPAMEIGAGFLRFDMSLVRQIVEADPGLLYVSEDPGALFGSVGVNLWGEGVVVDDWQRNGVRWPRFRTEDFAFCDRVRALGEVIWADTLCQVGHVGRVDYLEIARMIQRVRARVAD